MKDAKHRSLRFIVVGVSNTVLDFTLMNLLSLAGLNLIIANTISTGIAMIYSFLMNKKWTFRNAGQDYLRQVILFFIFTAIGIWVIQNGLIILAQHYLPRFGLSNRVFNNLAKLGASVFSLTWNYLTYNHFVFTDKR